MKRILYSLSVVGAFVFSSCSEWLDVEPKTNVEESDLFMKEQGFKEALTGVYMGMTTNSLYGRNLTYGFLDFLAQRYSVVDDSYDFSDPEWYEFEPTSNNTVYYTDNIWSTQYNLIANLNNLIANVDRNADVFTTPGLRDIIKGEALGLRSFLYFDLLRMFGPIYKNNPNAVSIPYRSVFDRSTAKLLPVKDVADSIICSLKEAERLLEDDAMDITFPIYNETSTADDFLRHRYKRMNKYAVKAELARVYLFKGDMAQAAACADEVVNARDGKGKKLFSLITDNSTDHLGSTELIFSLSMDSETFGDQVENDFMISNWTYYYIDSRDRVYELFDVPTDGSNDMRMKEGIGFEITVHGGFTRKFVQENFSYALDNTMPLIRLPEMYYILAEATDDLVQAAKYVNTVRGARGLEASNIADRDDLMYEIEKEYRKEFYAEGQLWYFYKRLGYETFQFCPLDKLTEANYKFALPDDEVSLGDIY